MVWRMGWIRRLLLCLLLLHVAQSYDYFTSSPSFSSFDDYIFYHSPHIFGRADSGCPDSCSNSSSTYPLAESKSFADGPGLRGGVTTQTPTSVFVQLVDSCNNLRRVDSFATLPELTASIVVEGLPSAQNPSATVTTDGDKFFISYTPRRAGNYQLRIEINGVAIYGSPFALSWIDGSTCKSYEPTKISSKPVPFTGSCSYYSENSCCGPEDLAERLLTVQEFAATYNSSECVALYEVLACGLACSPAQEVFVQIYESGGTNSSTNVTRVYSVCSSFANEFFSACSDVIVSGTNLTVSQLFGSAENFVRMNTVSDQFEQLLNDTACFDGYRVRTSGANSYVLEDESKVGQPGYGLSHTRILETRAGDTKDFALQAVDIYKNPRQISDDSWALNILGVSNNRQNITGATSPMGGQYAFLYSVTLASTTPYQFIVRNNGTDNNLVLFSPFSILVKPGDIYGNNTLVGEVSRRFVIKTTQNFTLTARDRYGNYLLTGGNSTFFFFNFLNATSLSTVTSTQSSFSIIDNCDGTYSVSFIAPDKKGQYILEIFSYDNDNDFKPILVASIPVLVVDDCLPDPDCAGNGDCVNGTCVCYPGWTGPDCFSRTICIPCSIAYGKGLSTTKVSETTHFTIQANDVYFHRLFYGGFDWVVEAFWHGIKLNTTFSVVDLNNGLSDVIYTPNVVGTVEIRISLNNTDIRFSPYTVTWIGPPCPNDCCGNGICFHNALTSESACECVSDIYTRDSCCVPILRVSSVRFSSIGVAVLVEFNAPTNMAGMIGIDNCSKVIDNPEIFGIGPYCVWPKTSLLAIWLGSEAVVRVGDSLILKSGVIKSAVGFVDVEVSRKRDQSYIIGVPSDPISPRPIIHAPIHMSACADLVLDASASLGTGGRAMNYTWDIVSGPANWRAVRQYLRILNTESVVFPSDFVRDTFAEGEEYQFTLNVVNHLNYTSPDPSIFSVSFAFDPIPTLNVVPSFRTGVLATRVHHSLKLHAAAISSGIPFISITNSFMRGFAKSSCAQGCVTPFLAPRDQLQYSWTQLAGEAIHINTDTSNTQSLYIAAGTLRANEAYTVNVRAQHPTYTSFLGQTQVELSVLPSIPYTEINGGAFRTFTLTRDPAIVLVLNAMGSVDFDLISENFTFSWSCVDMATGEQCFDTEAYSFYITNSSYIVIPSYELPIGSFLINVTAQKTGGLPATAAAIVRTITRGPSITAGVVGMDNSEDLVNAGDKIVLSASAQSSSEEKLVKWKWSVLSGPLNDSDLEQVLVTTRYLPNLIFKPGVLGANQAYVFKVEATDYYGTGSALVNMVVRHRPSAGLCRLYVNDTSPVTGNEEAYQDTFGIVCHYWEDEFPEGDAPLRYRFFAEPVGTGRRYPLGPGLSDKPSVEFKLPSMSVQLHVEVIDQNGVMNSYSLRAKARLADRDRILMTNEELAEWIRDNVLDPAIRAGDMAEAGQAIWFMADLINRPRNATLLGRYVDDELMQTERMVAAATEELSDAQLQEYRQLLDKRGTIDAQLRSRRRLRTHLISTLLYDYGVEYDVYGIAQRLVYLALISKGGEEITDDQIVALIGTLDQLSRRLNDFLTIIRKSSSLQDEVARAFLDAYSSLLISLNDESRTASFRMKNAGNLFSILDRFILREMAGLTSGDLAADYATEALNLQWNKNFLSLFEPTISIGQTSVSLSEDALNALTKGDTRRTVDDPLQPSVRQNETQLEYTFVEYIRTPYTWSDLAVNISTSTVGIQIFSQGEKREVNLTNAAMFMLPIKSLPAESFQRRSYEQTLRSVYPRVQIDVSRYTAKCLFWDTASGSFSSSVCSLSSLTATTIQCSCAKFGFIAAQLVPLALPSPNASPSPAIISKAQEDEFLTKDEAVLLTVFVPVMVILLFVGAVIMYWRRKHEATNEDDLDAFLLSWEAEAEEEPAEPEPVPIPELEEEDEYWAYEPAYEPAPYSPGAQAESGEPQSEQPEDQPPPEEDDEDDNLELMEWTGNRGETRLTRIARGAGERGLYGVTSTKREQGYTSMTFQMGPRLKRSESIRSVGNIVQKKKTLQAKADIHIESQSTTKRGQVV